MYVGICMYVCVYMYECACMCVRLNNSPCKDIHVQHRDFCSVLCDNLDERGVWGRMDPCVYVAELQVCLSVSSSLWFWEPPGPLRLKEPGRKAHKGHDITTSGNSDPSFWFSSRLSPGPAVESRGSPLRLDLENMGWN